MKPEQLDLFNAAPSAKRAGGRFAFMNRSETRGRKFSGNSDPVAGSKANPNEIALDRALQEKLEYLVAHARKGGCSHIEISSDGMLFVVPTLVGRDPKARYIPLESPHVRDAVLGCGK